MGRIISSLCLLCFCSLPAFSATPKYVGIDLYVLEVSTLSSVFPRSAANGIVVGQGVPPLEFNNHAILWTGPDGEAVDLQPVDFETSIAHGTDGAVQVGVGSKPNDFEQALMWQGSADSSVNLHPTNLAGIQASRAFGVGGSQQVGSMAGPGTGNSFHAALWNGSSDSAINLHPTSLNYIVESTALATDGVQQVGNGRKADGYRRALAWTSMAASAVDLHPLNFNGLSDESEALGVGGSQQVGQASGNSTGGRNHAFLWTGNAASAVDLHPTLLPGFFDTFALATNGQHQVGYGGIVPNTSAFSHALLWSGTAASAVNLHEVLSSSEFSFTTSRATSIDSHGTIFGIATDNLARFHAVMWVPVPEPSSMCFSVLALAGLVNSRSRRFRTPA